MTTDPTWLCDTCGPHDDDVSMADCPGMRIHCDDEWPSCRACCDDARMEGAA